MTSRIALPAQNNIVDNVIPMENFMDLLVIISLFIFQGIFSKDYEAIFGFLLKLIDKYEGMAKEQFIDNLSEFEGRSGINNSETSILYLILFLILARFGSQSHCW